MIPLDDFDVKWLRKLSIELDRADTARKVFAQYLYARYKAEDHVLDLDKGAFLMKEEQSA